MAKLGKGAVIGNYRVIRTLGRGGMGIVYEVEHLELGTHYALKTFAFDPGHEAAPAMKAKFLEEGRLLARLKHPNLTHVFDLGFEEKTQVPYFVMNLVTYEDGESYTVEDIDLKDIDEEMVYGWFRQLASALDYIHGEGIVHRDIKPGNLLVDQDLNIVLTDFGVSHIFGAKIRKEVDAERTVVAKTGRGKLVLGTEHYIAPEIADGEEATPQSDAYSLGVMLLRWLTGFYYGDNPGALALLSKKKYRWLNVISRLLAPAGRRPESYTALVKTVKPSAKSASAAPQPQGGKKPKAGVVVALASLLVAGALCAGGYLAWRHVERKRTEARQTQTAELERRMAEAEKAERERIAAEKAKKEAEEKRLAEENARKEAEARRLAEEKARKDAEAKRMAEEKERIAAEEKARREAEEKSKVEETVKPAVAEAKPDANAAAQSPIPTEDEIKAAMPKIEEVTRADFDALKAGRKTRAETADALLAYIGEDDDAVSKFIFRREAFRQCVLGAEFEKAEGLYTALRSGNGIEYALGIAGVARHNLGKSAARALREKILADERTLREVASIKAKIARSPKNVKFRERLASEYVASGDWESALRAFPDCGGEAAKVAEWELAKEKKDAAYDAVKVARFWWTFAESHAGNRQIAESVKLHAAEWYRKALALNLLSGLDAKVANSRIEECEAFAAQSAVMERREKGLYMVIDLARGGKQGVTYLDEAPKGGWSDDFRTKKIALRRIAPGSFEYMPGKSFKITKPFYIGVFEVTQKQYEMTMKANPAELKGDMRPVEKVSWIDIRGAKKGLNWPKDNRVDGDSYLGKMRKRYGLEFDLPTEVQWEYACRAGTKGDFNVDGVEMVKLGKCAHNGGKTDNHVKVGSFLPNAWGLYDMHGNVWEWCADRGGGDGWADMPWTADAKETETDPKGPALGSSRIRRGGSWNGDARLCRSSRRFRNDAGVRYDNLGFRLFCSAETAR